MQNAPYDIYDYELQDANGRGLGRLTGFWVNDTTNEPEFASVKTGWLLGKEHLVPISSDQIDHSTRTIRVPYDQRAIRDAPSFAADHHLDLNEEQRVYDHYRLGGRYARGSFGDLGTRDLSTSRMDLDTSEEVEIPLHEEHVQVGKRTVDEGVVRLRKVVRTEVEEVPVDLRRERIDVERIPASELRDRSGVAGGFGAGEQDDLFRERDITMTERREEPVVEKTSELVGGVRATRQVDRERETVRADVRREDVDIEREEQDRDRDLSSGPGR